MSWPIGHRLSESITSPPPPSSWALPLQRATGLLFFSDCSPKCLKCHLAVLWVTQWLWDASLEAISTEVWWRRSFVPVLLCSMVAALLERRRQRLLHRWLWRAACPTPRTHKHVGKGYQGFQTFSLRTTFSSRALRQEVGEHQRRPSRLRNSFCPGAVQLLTWQRVAVLAPFYIMTCATQTYRMLACLFSNAIYREVFFVFYKVYFNIL